MTRNYDKEGVCNKSSSRIRLCKFNSYVFNFLLNINHHITTLLKSNNTATSSVVIAKAKAGRHSVFQI